MKQLLLALCLFAVSTPLLGFRTTLSEGDRIAVLRPSDRYDRGAEGAEDYVARTVSHYLVRELRARGLDAWQADMTYDDLAREERRDADFYVEVVGSEGYGRPYGGVAVGGHHGVVDLAVMVSRVAAVMRLYDAETLELVDEYDLQRRNTAVLPTAIGLGRRHVGAWIALPFFHHARYRHAARAVARDAAYMIAVETDKQAARK